MASKDDWGRASSRNIDVGSFLGWFGFGAIAIAWIGTGVVLGADFPAFDDWRLIPNWIMPWFEGELRPSDPFHDHHPSLGIHILYVANAAWFGFHQKLLLIAGLTGSVALSALLARRVQQGTHGWRAAAAPTLVAAVSLSAAQPVLFHFPLAAVLVPWLGLHLWMVDQLFSRDLRPVTALGISLFLGAAFGILHSDLALVFSVGTLAAVELRARCLPVAQRAGLRTAALGLTAGAGVAFVCCRALAGLPASETIFAFSGLVEEGPRYLIEALTQGLSRAKYLQEGLGGAATLLVGIVYSALLGAATWRAARRADDPASFLMLVILGIVLVQTGFAFLSRGGLGGEPGEVARYEGFRMYSSVLLIWAGLQIDTPTMRRHPTVLAAVSIVFLGLIVARVDAARKLYALAPALIELTDTTARMLACTDPDDRQALRRLANGRAPGARMVLPWAFRNPRPENSATWHYLWWEWTDRFPAIRDPDWRVVVIENGLRFLRTNRLAGMGETPEDCSSVLSP